MSLLFADNCRISSAPGSEYKERKGSLQNSVYRYMYITVGMKCTTQVVTTHVANHSHVTIFNIMLT